MHALYGFLLMAILVLLINMPFGYWRAYVRTFSASWFVAVHAPVLIGIGVRLLLGVSFRFAALPLYALAFFAGQSAGGRIRVWNRTRG